MGARSDSWVRNTVSVALSCCITTLLRFQAGNRPAATGSHAPDYNTSPQSIGEIDGVSRAGLFLDEYNRIVTVSLPG